MNRKEVGYVKNEASTTTLIEGGLPDLVVIDVNTAHSKNNRIHYITVRIKNNSIITAQENFTLGLFIELRNKETGVYVNHSKPIRERLIRGLGGGEYRTCLFLYDYLIPDEEIWEARFYAYVDFYKKVKESNEDNNKGYGDWFPPY